MCGVCCHFGLIDPLFSVSLLVDRTMHGSCLSEFLHLFLSAFTLFVLPWALCVIRDCAKCSCYFNELLWVSPFLWLFLSSACRQSLGPLCVSPDLCFSFRPPCSHPPSIQPSAPRCDLQAPFRSKLVETLHSCQRPGCLCTGKKRN